MTVEHVGSSDSTGFQAHCPLSDSPSNAEDCSSCQSVYWAADANARWFNFYDSSSWSSGEGWWWMPTNDAVKSQAEFISASYVQQDNSSRNMMCTSSHDSNMSEEVSRTTVMLRNLPNNYTREMLLELVNSEGFEGAYDFLYLPIDFKSQAGLGYAFVNLLSPSVAQRFWKHFDGFSRWSMPTDKVCTLNWSSPHQGLAAHIERYRNSPVMHEDVSDDCKPMMFASGLRIPFPPPTKPVKAPRLRVR